MAGFSRTEDGQTRTMTVKEMAEAMVANYDEMLESIREYEGFYVGRYELSASGEKRNYLPLSESWYSLYKKCTELKANDKVKTEMIWGCQWDAICSWISTRGDRKDLSSFDWGKYEEWEEESFWFINTGSNEDFRANNIYDLAGNFQELTQEAGGADYRIARGRLR